MVGNVGELVRPDGPESSFDAQAWPARVFISVSTVFHKKSGNGLLACRKFGEKDVVGS